MIKVKYLIYLDNCCCFYRIEEIDILQEVVDKSLACKTTLTDIVKFECCYLDKDLQIVSNKLTIALKALIFNLSVSLVFHKVFIFFLCLLCI